MTISLTDRQDKFDNDGWKIYNAVAEFERQGISMSGHWRIDLDLNKGIKLAVIDYFPVLI